MREIATGKCTRRPRAAGGHGSIHSACLFRNSITPHVQTRRHTRAPRRAHVLSHWHLSPPQPSLYIAVVLSPSPNMSMESRLAQVAGLNQKDKATAYQSILTDLLARPDQTTLAHDLHILVENVVQESTGLVIGRQVLSELVKALEAGIVADVELRKQIDQDTLDIIQPRIVSYEEQVCRTLWNLLGCHILNAKLGQLAALPAC